MSALDGLEPSFRAKVEALLADLAGQGLTFLPYFGVRDLATQARLWRQSRTSPVVADEIAKLRLEDAGYLANILYGVGTQRGPAWRTDAIPGMSWHNMRPGMAVDCVLMRDGAEVWDGGEPAYTTYADLASKYGIYSGAPFHDIDHLQAYPADRTPLDIYGSMAALSRQMEADWG